MPLFCHFPTKPRNGHSIDRSFLLSTLYSHVSLSSTATQSSLKPVGTPYLQISSAPKINNCIFNFIFFTEIKTQKGKRVMLQLTKSNNRRRNNPCIHCSSKLFPSGATDYQWDPGIVLHLHMGRKNYDDTFFFHC